MKFFSIIVVILAMLIGSLIGVAYYSAITSPVDKPIKTELTADIKPDLDKYRQYAKDYYYQGNYAESKNVYKKILIYEPDNIDIYNNLIMIAQDQGNLDEVNKYLKEVIALTEDKSYILDIGINNFNQGKYSQTIAYLQPLIDDYIESDQEDEFKELSNREITLIYYYLGRTYQALEEYEFAEDYLQKAINLDKDFVLAYISFAEVKSAMNDYNIAYDYYLRARKIDPSLTYLYPEIATLLENNERYRDAYHYWQRSIWYNERVELARKHITNLEKNYPELKPEEEEMQINDLIPDWKEISSIPNQAELPKLNIGLQDQIDRIIFQSSSDFVIKSADEEIYQGKASHNYELILKETGYYIINNDTDKFLTANNDIRLVNPNNDDSFYIYNINYGKGYFWHGYADRQYRGQIKLIQYDKKFNLINNVDITSYLLSVVPSEIYSSWPQESLKAQAVAARSYSLRHIGRHQDEGYDLCSSVHCAVYKGVGVEKEATTNAVIETQGMAAYYDDKVIDAVFSSNSGGYTERSGEIWLNDIGYLTGVNHMEEEKYSFPLEPGLIKEWLRESPPSYSRIYGGANRYRWELVLPAYIIESYTSFENVTDLVVMDRTEGGSISRLKVVSEEGEKELTGYRIRALDGGIRSNRFYFEKIYDPSGELKEIVIFGGGYGHNVGFDQSGAAGMASLGWSYQNIIEHYYPGVEIKNAY